MSLAWNQSLFLWLNHAAGALPDWFWSSLTITGHTSVIFALFAPLLLRQSQLTRLPTKGRVVITGLFAAAMLGGILSTAAKETFQVLRPPAVLLPAQFHLIGHKLELVSFPSGHTISAFAATSLLIFGLQLCGWRLAGALFLACLIGLSRIAVGAHWPLDVLGGALLGTLCGWVGLRLALLLHRQTWTQGVAYLSCQSAIIGVVSLSLFVTDTGYPAAMIWQYLAGLFGFVIASYSVYLQLKSAKSPLKE